MSGEDHGLERECRALSRLLVGREPNAYVIARYKAAHGPGSRFESEAGYDALLVRLATRLPPLRRPAAAYARLFRPEAALQRKLILLLALLESSSPSYRLLDARLRGGAVGSVFTLTFRVLWWAVAVVIGVPIMGWLALIAGRGSDSLA